MQGEEDVNYEPPAEFRSIINATVEQLLRAAQPSFDAEDGWELLRRDKNGVESHRKKPKKVAGERFVMTVRGRGKVRCDARQFRDLVTGLDAQIRRRWDPLFAAGKVVQRLDQHTSVVWLELRSKKCVIDFHRDLLYMQHSREIANGVYVVASRSAGVLQDDSLMPVPPGALRGTLHTSGYVIRPLRDELGNCEVSFNLVLRNNFFLRFLKKNLPRLSRSPILLNVTLAECQWPFLIELQRISLSPFFVNDLFMRNSLEEVPRCRQRSWSATLTRMTRKFSNRPRFLLGQPEAQSPVMLQSPIRLINKWTRYWRRCQNLVIWRA